MSGILQKLISFFISTPINTSRSIIVEAKPYFVTNNEQPYTKRVTHDSLLGFAKSKKMNKNYIFDINDNNETVWKFSLKKVFIENQCIKYELQYSTKGKDTVSLRELQHYISDGFHKTTNAGDLIPLKTKKDNIFVKIYADDVKVFQ